MNEWTQENADTSLLFDTKERRSRKGETIRTPLFRGHEVSDFGIEHGQVDLCCFVQGMNHVLCNNITQVDPELFDERVCGYLYKDADGNYYEEYEDADEEDEDEDGDDEDAGSKERYLIDFYQFYIVDEAAVSLLEKIGETVCYSDVLNCNVWCVQHVGSSWRCVLTGIRIPQ